MVKMLIVSARSWLSRLTDKDIQACQKKPSRGMRAPLSGADADCHKDIDSGRDRCCHKGEAHGVRGKKSVQLPRPRSKKLRLKSAKEA